MEDNDSVSMAIRIAKLIEFNGKQVVYNQELAARINNLNKRVTALEQEMKRE